MTDRFLFSFVVDSEPRFLYQGYHLARSIQLHCPGEGCVTNVCVTPEVPPDWRDIFTELGCRVLEISRFGDGRYCNKVSQLEHLSLTEFDYVILLDTDTILIEDIRRYMLPDVLQAKIVDYPNPSLDSLKQIAEKCGLSNLPLIVPTDSGVGETYSGNCNGGFYAIPAKLLPIVVMWFPHWVKWLLADNDVLRRERKEMHTDQVAMWLTIHHKQIPFAAAKSNLNYYVHRGHDRVYYDANAPICLLHYHSTLNVVGLIAPTAKLSDTAMDAIAAANRQIAAGFDNRVFWNFRYNDFSDRGSGVGSRGEPLHYKRALLRAEGIEDANSVLDIGCGDLEVIRAFNIENYSGLDISREALVTARRVAQPHWNLALLSNSVSASVAPAELVLCFEVLIHQPTEVEYRQLIALLAEKTLKTLLVSGYDSGNAEIISNHMTYFYEPLADSLARLSRFKTISEIGGHTSVKIYRCTV